AEQYIIKDVIPSGIGKNDRYNFKNKFKRISNSENTDLIIEKEKGRYGTYYLMGIKHNDKFIANNFHYLKDENKEKSELFDTIHELIDLAISKKLI
ncbi:MAG: hypothetical protein MJ180_06240, partial [Candidatus Gastranaerophilales bacterium]|nr:hypothetical protein [Candidatus Gastranaerophilales bacterium]